MIPKFRIFDKKKKRFLDDFAMEIDRDGINVLDEFNYVVDEDDRVLMQATGLTDKNGKEIFEGDIVKALSEGYCGTFQVVWRNEGTPMYILYPAWQNEQFWDLKGVNGVDDGIEVIGNIHEHPELLENI
ncbi:YopX family protein [Macrococcoides caseolyticum]|uniref:YopX family protein n=1 Tax=Macrococcoides caseolyticum TaxID=69966 RepID=UPI000C348FFD|nr:YopX family protein [Macrococcus caseolyticus]PKE63935.1 hypothetical protein CW683_03075 [Macrococcus caseolyticus]PKE67400.1 hypothetical protein CW663_08050 [Macrococcus caseolyticus]